MRTTIGSIAFLILATGVVAQPPGATEDRYPPTEIKIHPRPVPTPRLKFALVTPERQQVKGNAAVSYHRATLFRREVITDQKAYSDELNRLYEMLQKEPTEELKQALRLHTNRFKNTLKELEFASLRDHCDWDIDSRLDEQGISTLLPEIQSIRELAQVLNFRCRLHVLENNVEAALNDLRIGFTMAKHVGDGPTLIQALVGMAILGIFSGDLDRVLQMQETPNLYWSLSALPKMVNLRKAMDGELRGSGGTLPMWREVDKGVMSPEAARKAMASFTKTYVMLASDAPGANAGEKEQLMLATFVALRHPKARKTLIEYGYKATEVESMPSAQAVILEGKLLYQSLMEEMHVWFDRPFLEGQAGLTQTEQRIKKIVNEGGDLDVFGASMVKLLLPAAQKVHFAYGRTERRIAISRTIEAIRLHAHEMGELPKTLSEIKGVVVPDDPVTGKPFEYTLENGIAKLNGMPPDQSAPHPGNSVRYVIRLVK
jgi:hypothetical protein